MSCPRCGSVLRKKHGHTQDGRRRWRCTECARIWVDTKKPKAAIPACNDCGTRLIRWGKTADGIQRLWCKDCQRSTQIKHCFPYGQYASVESVERVRVALAAGASGREAARIAGVAKESVWRWLKKGLVTFGTCPCGGPSGHRGWCKYRFYASAARQAMKAKLTLAKMSESERAEALMALRLARLGSSGEAVIPDTLAAKLHYVSHEAIDILMQDPELFPC